MPGFAPEPTWPCVGDLRVVPDYISLLPQSQQVAPFAGASRHLCDRKEVTLSDQAGAIAKFYIYTSTHKAAKFTGVITDDFTSEFDPFSPQFGEKFAPPNMLNSPNLVGSLTGLHLTCPTNHSNCGTYSNPYLANDVFWQNRSFQVGAGALSAAVQQNIVTLYNSAFTGGGALGAALMNQPRADATTPNGAGSVITGGTESAFQTQATGTSAFAAIRDRARPPARSAPQRSGLLQRIPC